MELAGRVKVSRASGLPTRIITIRQPKARTIQDALRSAWERVPTGFKLLLSRLKESRVAFVLGLLTIGIFVAGLHYYNVLSREIDARLRGDYFDNSVGILSSPFSVAIGDRMQMNELAAYLHAAGYRQAPCCDELDDAGSYQLEDTAIEIIPSRVASSQLGLQPVRIAINNRGRVVSLTNALTGQRLNSAIIEGELLASVRNGDRRKRTSVHFDDIPEGLRNAVLAAEDRRFFSHSGIDWRGIGRALWVDIRQGGIVQGGSTITQQLIKNCFLTGDRTLSRKLKEAAMAVILESRLSKQEIFTLYCNDVYLGHSGTFAIHGFAEAAQVYFGKNLADLSLAESALLAGLIRAPNRYSAHRDLSLAVERRNLVLDQMVAIEAVSPDEAEAAKREPLQIKRKEGQQDYGTSYFIDYAQRFIEERYGPEGLTWHERIYTTMDPRLQRAAFDAVSRHTERLDKLLSRPRRKGTEPSRVQAALVAIDAHTGEVLAMVGGRSYDQSQLNRATDARRQPGSTFKPFVYASALGSRAFTAATLISDKPQTFTYDGGRSEYKPSNYHGAFTNREVTLREAVTRSLNVPAVEVAMRTGLGAVADLAEDCGMPRPHAYPSMALGASEVTPLELAAGYTAFVNNGTALRPIPIKYVTGSEGGARTAELKATGARVFSPQLAYLMTDLMQSVVDRGTAVKLRAYGVRGAVAGKTGTSSDGWFAGYTPNLVCVVWVGFDDNKDLRLKGSDTALPIWSDFVREATAIRPHLGGDSFPRPGGIVTVEIDPSTGYLATSDCSERRQELFIAGTEPFATCSHAFMMEEDLSADLEGTAPEGEAYNADHSKILLDICTDTGLLASYKCPRTTMKLFEVGREPLANCRADHDRRKAIEYPEPNDKVLPLRDPDRLKRDMPREMRPPRSEEDARRRNGLY